MTHKQKSEQKPEGGAIPPTEKQQILSMPEAIGYMEMTDLKNEWPRWRHAEKLGHTEGLLVNAHKLTEKYLFCKPEYQNLGEAEQKWHVACTLERLVLAHLWDGIYDARYAEDNQYQGNRYVVSGMAQPLRYRNSKNRFNNKIFPFMEGKGLKYYPHGGVEPIENAYL